MVAPFSRCFCVHEIGLSPETVYVSCWAGRYENHCHTFIQQSDAYDTLEWGAPHFFVDRVRRYFLFSFS